MIPFVSWLRHPIRIVNGHSEGGRILSRPPPHSALMETAVHGTGIPPSDSTLWVACYNRERSARTRHAPRFACNSEFTRNRSFVRAQALTTSHTLLVECPAPIRS